MSRLFRGPCTEKQKSGDAVWVVLLEDERDVRFCVVRLVRFKVRIEARTCAGERVELDRELAQLCRPEVRLAGAEQTRNGAGERSSYGLIVERILSAAKASAAKDGSDGFNRSEVLLGPSPDPKTLDERAEVREPLLAEPTQKVRLREQTTATTRHHVEDAATRHGLASFAECCATVAVQAWNESRGRGWESGRDDVLAYLR